MGRTTIAVAKLSVREESVSRQLADLWTAYAPTYVDIDRIDLRDVPPRWMTDADVADLGGAYARVADALRGSWGLVLAYPVHCYTSASQAHWFVEAYGELIGSRPVHLLTAAGTRRSFLAGDDVVRSLHYDAGAFVYPKMVQAVEDHVVDGALDDRIVRRMRAAVQGFVDFCVALQPIGTGSPAPRHATPSQFVELFVPDPDRYVPLLVDCLGYRQAHRVGQWVDLRRAGDRLLLNGEPQPDEHVFAERALAGARRGLGVEIGIVVDDVDRAYEQVAHSGAWQVEPLTRREWGARDFRIVTPDGYYLRVTERPGV